MMLGIVFFASEVYGATPAQVGILSATWSASYVVGCLFLRPLSSRMLPRYSMIAASGVSICGYTAERCACGIRWPWPGEKS